MNKSDTRNDRTDIKKVSATIHSQFLCYVTEKLVEICARQTNACCTIQK